MALVVDVMMPTVTARRCNAGIRGDVPDSHIATVRRGSGSCDPARPVPASPISVSPAAGCESSGHRTDQGRWCGPHSGGSAEPPIGGVPRSTGSSAKPCATRADRSLYADGGRDFSVIGVKSWRLADLGSKHALLLAGIGWGNMPEPMVRDDLAAGRLRWLDLPEWLGGFYALHAIHRTDTPPGPAAAWLIRHFFPADGMTP